MLILSMEIRGQKTWNAGASDIPFVSSGLEGCHLHMFPAKAASRNLS